MKTTEQPAYLLGLVYGLRSEATLYESQGLKQYGGEGVKQKFVLRLLNLYLPSRDFSRIRSVFAIPIPSTPTSQLTKEKSGYNMNCHPAYLDKT